MRGGIWLYLALLAKLTEGADTLNVLPAEIAAEMGLSEGTVRSFLGHLRKGRYVAVRRVNGGLRIRVKCLPAPAMGDSGEPARAFTVPNLERALGEGGNRAFLENALTAHPDPVIRSALAGALAVPAAEIRRSRTALFLYLLKRHAQDPSHHPRP